MIQNLVATSHGGMFRINHLDLSWEHEIVSSAREAVVRLSGLCAIFNSSHLTPLPASDLTNRADLGRKSEPD